MPSAFTHGLLIQREILSASGCNILLMNYLRYSEYPIYNLITYSTKNVREALLLPSIHFLLLVQIQVVGTDLYLPSNHFRLFRSDIEPLVRPHLSSVSRVYLHEFSWLEKPETPHLPGVNAAIKTNSVT